MFSFTVLGSGSAGNCALVQSDRCRLLIDAGLSARQIVSRLAERGITPDQLEGILLTHEHGDHVSGLEVLCRQWPDLAIYCTSITGEALRYQQSSRGRALESHKNWRYFRAGSEFAIEDFTVQTFAVPHDAVEPVGFVLESEQAGKAHGLGFLTDLGHVTKGVLERVKEVSTLFIEANYDTKLLTADSRRPWSTKQRIMSRHGHLSNAVAAETIAQILSLGQGRLQRAILGHLSRDCNSPVLVQEAMQAEIKKITGQEKESSNIDFFCASQSEVSPVFEMCVPPPTLTSVLPSSIDCLDLLKKNEIPTYHSIQLDLF